MAGSRLSSALLALTLIVAGCHPAFAQGPTGGSIFGTVTDTTGAFLSGVRVTCASSAQIGIQSAVTNDRGHYRFPLLAPGIYRLSYERTGFTTVVRENIVVSVEFAAEIDVELVVATIQATTVVHGDSPLIDTQNTTIQSIFTSETLKALPNARDLMSVIGLVPATIMSIQDVGGSTVGTQPVYLTYGQFSLQQFQSRVQVDGVNTTDAGVAGVYLDYGAFDEVRLGTSSNDASMPNPGLQVNAVLKAGGNAFKGEAYVDFGSEAFEADNIDEGQRRQGVGRGTRIQTYYDPNVNIGGPIKRDALWFFTSVRNQHLTTLVTGFPVDGPGTGPQALILLQNLTYKLTYRLRPRHTLSHFVQVGRRHEPYRDASSTTYRDAVADHDSLSWVGNLEWRAITSSSFFMTTRASTFGSDVRANAYGTDGQVGVNVAARRIEFAGNSAGGFESFSIGRRRRQLEWAGTLFGDDWRGVNHALRMGALTEWETTDTERTGPRDSLRLRFQSPAGTPDFTVPFQIQLYNYPLTSSDRLWHHGAFAQDQIALTHRWTLNLGLRWDAYSAYYPEQRLREGPFTDFFYRGVPLHNGYSIPVAPFGDTVPARHSIIEYRKAFGPRVGLAWEVQGSGKTVVKASWGRYYHDPGTTISRDVNPLQTTTSTFAWNDGNADRLFQPSELGSFVNSSGGVQNRVDPDIQDPYTDNTDVWVERRLRSDLSARLGFIYKKANNNWDLVEQVRTAALFSEPRQFPDPGPDGLPDTADDQGSYTAFDIPAGVPIPASVKEWQTPADFDQSYKNIEVAVNKRMTHGWSLSSSFLFTWVHNLQNGHPDNPNEAINNDVRVTGWAFKVFGTYRAPWGLNISPIVRHQAGRPSGRYVLTNLQRVGNVFIAVEPSNYREDNRTILDTRVEKQLRLWNARSLGVFIDAFNVFNSNAAQAQDTVTGRRTTVIAGERIDYQRFFRPLIVLPPRLFRFGFNLAF
ncbi:MAG TPA: carboxypeptidase regulatory-like domain-containing protein [Vicinamibacterales bacterium]|nr:carboxypeptidase regulatory-like domain-containing protein [Vicinamibacterales bacterium]